MARAGLHALARAPMDLQPQAVGAVAGVGTVHREARHSLRTLRDAPNYDMNDGPSASAHA